MSQRGILFLLAAIVVLAGLALFGQRDETTGAAQGGALLPGLSAALNDVDRVIVTKSGNETVATLERRPDTWVVAEKGGYPADVGTLRQTLLALGEARIIEAKTANPELHDRLGVEDLAAATAAGIGLTLRAGERELGNVILGESAGDYRYARRAAEQQSYLIDRDPDVPRTAAQWVDARIIDLRSDRVRQVTIAHPDGETVTVSKATPEAANYDVANVPADRELMYPGVANVIGNGLRELNLEDVQPAAASTPPEEGVVRVELRTFDGLVVTAEGFEQDDAAWVSFAARFEPAQAGDAVVAAAPAEGDAAAEPAAEPEQAAAERDVAAEAQRINETTNGWRYRIASYQFDQLTRRMADLLKAPE